MKHEDVWRALDTLAAEKGLSPSGLARAAGLDPTAFNPSKRATRSGLRWPSTESLSRVLAATGASLETFSALVGGARALTMGRTHRARHLPLLPLSRLGEDGLFDDAGYPTGSVWEETEVPQPADPHGYAVRVDTARLEPVFRKGATLILSPEASVGAEDRVLIRVARRIEACIVGNHNGSRLLAIDADPQIAGRPVTGAAPDWLHRIVWSSL